MHTIAQNAASQTDSSRGELVVQIPQSVKKLLQPSPAANGALVRIRVSYTVTGSNGSLRFGEFASQVLVDGAQASAPGGGLSLAGSSCAPAQHYAFTALRPGHGGAIAANGLGPRCVFPCIDALDVSCTWDMGICVAGADADGAICSGWSPAASPFALGRSASLQMSVMGAGDTLPPQAISSSSFAAVFAGKQHSIDVLAEGAELAGAGGSPASRTKLWRFAIRNRVPACAVGFVAGPDLVSVERIDFSHISAARSVSASAAANSGSAVAAAAAAPAGATSLYPSTPAYGIADQPSTGSSAIAATSSEKHVTSLHHYAPPSKVSDGSAALHVKRTRRMMAWLTDWLRVRYPFNCHSHVFLPASVFAPISAIAASPTGLAPQLCHGQNSALHGDACADIFSMAGLTILPDSLLTSSRIIDSEASSHRAQAFGLVQSWVGCALHSDSWVDSWLSEGMARYITSLYFRSFRGNSDHELEIARANESLARLEEEHPSLLPLDPALVLGLSKHSVLQGSPTNASSSSAAAAADEDSEAPDRPPSLDALALAIQHPFRRHHVAIKGMLVCHVLAAHVGEGRFREAVSFLLSRATGGVASAAALSVNAPSQLQPSFDRSSSGNAAAGGVLAFGSSSSAASSGAGAGAAISSLFASAGAPSTPSATTAAIAASSSAAPAATSSSVPALPDPSSRASFNVRTFISTLKSTVGSAQKANEMIDALVGKWIRGRGVPQFHVGVAFIPTRNAVEVVVEQVMRPGTPIFKGDLLIHVAERPELGPADGEPDIWAHTFTISKIRESFTLPCHSRLLKVRPHQPGMNLKLGFPKRIGRPPKAAKIDVGGKAIVTQFYDPPEDADETNACPVRYVRVDPSQAWIKRMQVVVPPAMAIAQMTLDASAVGQIEGMTALATSLLPETAAVPGPVIALPSDAAAFPSTGAEDGDSKVLSWGSQNAGRADIERVLRYDTRSGYAALGYHVRPQSIFTPLYRIAAVLSGVDPSKVWPGKEFDRSGGNGSAAASASGADDVQDIKGHPPSAESHDDVDDDSSNDNEITWQMRDAAAFLIARWQSGHLPAYGKPLTSGPAAGMASQTFAGVATLIAMYQHLFYESPAALPGASSAAARPASLRLSVKSLLSLLSSFEAASEDDVLKLAQGGTPGSIRIQSLEHLQLRRSLICAIGSIRHPDHLAPAAAVAFLTNVLGSYDAHAASQVVDDSELLVDLVRSLGHALNECDGRRRVSRILRHHVRNPGAFASASAASSSRDPWTEFLPIDTTGTLSYPSVGVYKRGWQVLREQLAMELAGLRYVSQSPPPSAPGSAPAATLSRDNAASGHVASACISALTLLETNIAAPALVLPMLRSYLLATHPNGGHHVPPRLRVAAFTGLARELLLTPTRTDEARAQWMAGASRLLQIAQMSLSASSSGAGGAVDAAVGHAMLQSFYMLHMRTDHVDSQITNLNFGGIGPAPIVVERLRLDLTRSMVKQRNFESELSAVFSGASADSVAKLYTTKWTFTEAAVDLGVFDHEADRMSLQEKRVYGMLRYAPSSSGCLSLLRNATPASNDARDCVHSLWKLLSLDPKAGSTGAPSSSLAYALIHSIFGMAPASSLVKQDVQSISAAARDSAFAANVDAHSDLRREAIATIRSNARSNHLQASLAYAAARNLQLSTGTAEKEEEEEEEEEQGEDSGAAAGEGAENAEQPGGADAGDGNVEVLDEEDDEEMGENEDENGDDEEEEGADDAVAAAVGGAGAVMAGGAYGAMMGYGYYPMAAYGYPAAAYVPMGMVAMQPIAAVGPAVVAGAGGKRGREG